MRPYALALDDAGIAVRRLKARLTAIDQQHVAAAPLQVERHANADDPGAQHDDICQTRTS